MSTWKPQKEYAWQSEPAWHGVSCFVKQLSRRLGSEIAKQVDDRVDISEYKALSQQYFEDHTSFLRHQDINPKYFIPVNRDTWFISHRWMTPDNPDPAKEHFNDVKKHMRDFEQGGVWYDFSSLPQKPRTAHDDEVFKKQLYGLNSLMAQIRAYTIPSDDYFDRSWCLAEYQYVSTDFSRREIHFEKKYVITLAALLFMTKHPRKQEIISKTINHLFSTTKLTNGGDREIVENILRSQFTNPSQSTLNIIHRWTITMKDKWMEVMESIMEIGLWKEVVEMAIEFCINTEQTDLVAEMQTGKKEPGISLSQYLDSL